jgi:hypothetical protein
MEVIVEHLKENATLYVIGLVVLAPAIFFTRKWSIPVILYTVEMALYGAIMHVVVWCMVVCGKWFKENTSMRALREDGTSAATEDWGTPLVEFWETEGYRPPLIMWVEVGLLVAIVFLVWKYRPPKLKRKPGRASAQKSQPGSMVKKPAKYPPQRGGRRR